MEALLEHKHLVNKQFSLILPVGLTTQNYPFSAGCPTRGNSRFSPFKGGPEHFIRDWAYLPLSCAFTGLTTMHHIIYMSTASWSMTEAELEDLLRQARWGNERRDITGVLVYGDGQFMQIMEGEQATLEALYDHIGQDRRHKGLFKLADRAIPARRFAEWSMGFEVVSSAAFEQLLGYVAPMQLAQQLPDLGAADSLFAARMRDLVLTPKL
jgi:hypothetical protein